MSEQCKNCKFFALLSYAECGINNENDEKTSVCRRFAPRILAGSGEGWSSQLFPKVAENMWCGEWEKIVPPEVE